jgi:hypothetical protein
MLAKTPLHEQMIAWLEQQDPNITYAWNNGCQCACARFAEEAGREGEWAEFMRSGGVYAAPDPEWDLLNTLANFDQVNGKDARATYGQLLRRLRATSWPTRS